MSELALGLIFLEIGMIIATALIVAEILKKLGIPTVLGLILGGLLFGLFEDVWSQIFSLDLLFVYEFIQKLALGWIGFEIGSKIDLELLKKQGKALGLILLGESLGAFLAVAITFYFLTTDLGIALILGSIAMATAPASTTHIISELNASGPLTQTILFIIAFDDILAILFTKISINIALGGSNLANPASWLVIFSSLGLELVFSIGLGIGTAIIVVYQHVLLDLDKRSRLEWLLGVSLVVLGISIIFEASTILTMLIFGISLKTLGRHHQEHKHGETDDTKFEELLLQAEMIMIPAVLLFFILVGIEMNLDLILSSALLLALAYFIARIIGKATGGYLTSSISHLDSKTCKNLSISLITQAGVAIGLAGLAFNEYTAISRPDLGNLIVNVIGVSIIFAEIVGPFLVRRALINNDEKDGICAEKPHYCYDV